MATSHTAFLATFGEVRGKFDYIPSAETAPGDLWEALDLLAWREGKVEEPAAFASVVPGRRAIVATWRHSAKRHDVEHLDEVSACKALKRLMSDPSSMTPG